MVRIRGGENKMSLECRDHKRDGGDGDYERRIV